MALEDKSPMLIRRRILFRDDRHVRRFEVRPYERVVVLCRGERPAIVPVDANLVFERGIAMVARDGRTPEFPAALLVVDAMYIKGFANWEVEDTDQMLDDIIEHGDRTMRAH
jgi:hypothetical protein